MAFREPPGGPKCDEMQLLPDRPRVAGSALTTRHFLLLYAAMLVAAAGNTALQSVMPAIGREIGISDFWVTVSYTWSAILWVFLAPFWAKQSDRHGRKALTLLGVGGFIASMLLCGLVLLAGSERRACGRADLRRVRHCPSALRVARLGDAQRDTSLSGIAHAPVVACQRRYRRSPAASASGRSSARRSRRLFVLPLLGLSGPLFVFAAIAIVVFVAILFGLPNDLKPRHGRRSGHGAAMSYPSLASSPTGASVIAATRPGAHRIRWTDHRIRRWITAGVIAGHAQAATLACIGFFVIDRLHLAPHGSEKEISIVMMAGAAATLAAQWGLIPRLGLGPACADPVGRADRRPGNGRHHVRQRPLRDRPRLWADQPGIRLHPPRLHRRREPCRSTVGTGRSRRGHHRRQWRRLRPRTGDRHAALRASTRIGRSLPARRC